MPKDSQATEAPKTAPKFRLVEITVDENLTKIRKLVPADTDEMDIPQGAEMFTEEETQVMLKRANRPIIILVGHQVRLKPTTETDPTIVPVMGNVESKLKSGKLRVKWDNGSVSRHDSTELDRVY